MSAIETALCGPGVSTVFKTKAGSTYTCKGYQAYKVNDRIVYELNPPVYYHNDDLGFGGVPVAGAPTKLHEYTIAEVVSIRVPEGYYDEE